MCVSVNRSFNLTNQNENNFLFQTFVLRIRGKKEEKREGIYVYVACTTSTREEKKKRSMVIVTIMIFIDHL